MTSSKPQSAAVIGAGVSGLTCARALMDAGFSVQVFDKSRGVGGRLATRRADYGTFDHGAQYFTARDPAFKQAVDRWTAQGLVAVWSPRLAAIDATTDRAQLATVGDSTVRHVGVPAMSQVGKSLAEGLVVHTDCQIASAQRVDSQWHLQSGVQQASRGVAANHDATAALGRGFDWLIAAMPSPQAADLFDSAPALRAQAIGLPMVPCWALLLRFDTPLGLGYDAAFISGSTLTWIARNGSKPGRDSGECWVLHAARDWSEAALERSPEAVVGPMLQEFTRVTGMCSAPALARAHRWRYSGPAVTQSSTPTPTTPAGATCLFDPQLQAGACGDWLAGSRVEGAFLSGSALAARIIGQRDTG